MVVLACGCGVELEHGLDERQANQVAALLEGAGNVYELAYLLASVTYTALLLGSDRDASEFAGRATQVTREVDSALSRKR